MKSSTKKPPRNKETTVVDDGKEKKKKTQGSQPTEAILLPVTATILGIDERTLMTLSSVEREQFIHRCIQTQTCFFRNQKTQTLVSCGGSFSTPTIQELVEQVSQLVVKKNTRKENRGTVVVPVLTTRSNVDIGELQRTLTTQDLAMVQVASNFNCLENASRHSSLGGGGGGLVDHAYRDSTQGPAAVFGTTSAYLYRTHFHNENQERSPSTTVPHLNDAAATPINLLQHTSQYFGIPQNGKLTLSGQETTLRTLADIDRVSSQVCIGLHQDCPVMFGRSNGHIIYKEPKRVATSNNNDNTGHHDVRLEFPLVDHVLSASINLKYYGIQKGQDSSSLNNLMRALLRAAYEGIYLAAILRQRKKLYLTLVGGGSFGNPISMIVEEMQYAHDKWASHPMSQLEECVVCLFGEGKDVQRALKS